MSSPQRSSGRRMAARPQKPPVDWGRWAWVGVGVAIVIGLVLTSLSAVGIGQDWFDRLGAAIIATAYTGALASRTGGRPVVFGAVAGAIGASTFLFDSDWLRVGAAVLTAVTTAVLSVMITVPARRFRHAVREALVAVVVAAVGGMAVVGFRPVVSLDRFDYVSLGLAFVLVVLLVFQLGAGLNGLGRRGLVVLLVGTAALVVAMAYAELLRRYGSQVVVEDVLDVVATVRDKLGAVPRPLQAGVGIPALVWGTHMRARRRQGWWVSAFGVAATTSVAGLLVNPDTGWIEAGLIITYSAIPGLVIGMVVIRLDLLFTGPRGRRARREEQETAIRPEPKRLEALL